MEKTKISLDILLPEVPDERDECVNRIIHSLQFKRGINKVHIVQNEHDKAALCFHYDPKVISIQQVEETAKKAGAALMEQYGHLLLTVKGVRHQRHAVLIEAQLKKEKGIISIGVSATGIIQLEYSKALTTTKKIVSAINALELDIVELDDMHEHVHQQGNKKEHHHHDHKHDHSHNHDGHTHDHSHEHGGIFGERSELYFALICGAFLGIGFGLSFIAGIASWIPIALYCMAYLFGGYFTTKEAIEGIRAGQFEIDFLMLVAAAGAAALGQWAEGALLLFLFSLGHSLEHYAMAKARKSIAALGELAPKTALLKKDDQLVEVNIDTLKKDDVIVVKPNSKIPADGIVVKGHSSVNQAPITGESVPVEKEPWPEGKPFNNDKPDAKHSVFAGTINSSEVLEIKVTSIAEDSTIARLVKLVNEAQTQKSATQNFTDKLEKYYVPSVLLLVVVLLFAFVVINEPFSKSFYRAMAVLVAASPCALAIATPSAVLSGVARAARDGVLIKGGKPLEELGSLQAIAFDKTGTLTEGKPALSGVYPLNNVNKEELLRMAVAVEKLSDHPLATAIVKGGEEALKQAVTPATGLKAITGKGITAMVNNAMISIGNKAMFKEDVSAEMVKQVDELEKQGNTTMLVKKDNAFIGMLTIKDKIRPDARETLDKLTAMGMRKVVMLTGDNQQVADTIAKEAGLTEAMGGLLPEEKVATVTQLKQSLGKVAMVGDGVNDAPAMAQSSVGIAMGAAGSAVALETADIALMADKLSNLPFAIKLSRSARNIIRQNLVISLGMVVLLVPLTITGIAHIGPAVIGHEGSTLVVVFNALRLLVFPKDK